MGVILYVYSPILMFCYLMLNKKIKYKFKFNKYYALILSFIIGILGLRIYTPISNTVNLEYFILLSTLVTLFNISIIDMEQLLIPDTYNVIIAGLGLLNIIFIKTHYLFFIMAIISFLSFLAISVISRGALGMGDVKLSFGLGLFLDIILFKDFLLYTFISGAIIGTIMILINIKQSKDKIAFGPFMALGFLLTLLS